MTVKDLIKGTFLEEIFELALKGNFGELEGAPSVGKNEVSLGKLNSLEIASKVYSISKEKEAMEMVNSGISAEDKRVQNILIVSHEAKYLSHCLILERFGKKTLEIRKGWNVVESTRESRHFLTERMKRGGFVLVDMSDFGSEFSESENSEMSRWDFESKTRH